MSQSNSAEEFLVIGRITKPHGVRGEVRVTVHTDVPERFTWVERVFLGLKRPRPIGVESARFNKQIVLLKLEGVDSRDDAEALRNVWIQIPESEAIPLEEGEYFLHQIIGADVVTEEGEQLGNVREMIETPANDVFVVKGAHGELLLPDIDDVILNVDVEGKKIVVRLIPGLIKGR